MHFQGETCTATRQKITKQDIGTIDTFLFFRNCSTAEKEVSILLVHQHVRCFGRQTAGNGGPNDRHSEREKRRRRRRRRSVHSAPKYRAAK